MPLFFFPLLFVVPFFALAMILFVVGSIVMRLLFFVAIAAFAAVLLFGTGLFGGAVRALRSGARQVFRLYQNRRFDELSRREPENSVFDDYRRATLSRLDAEAQEFRTFLARLSRQRMPPTFRPS